MNNSYFSVLPQGLENLKKSICEHFQVDSSLVNPAILGLASTLAHDKFKVKVYDYVTGASFLEPLSLFCFGIISASERKSSVLKWLKSPIQSTLDDINFQQEPLRIAQAIRREIAQERKKKLKNKILTVNNESSQGQILLEKLVEVEKELQCKKLNEVRLFLQDTTAIAAAEFMQNQHGNALSIVDGEGASFDAILEEHRLFELLLLGFSNENISFERSSKMSVNIKSPHASICILTQKMKLQKLAKKMAFLEEGFMSRCLVFMGHEMAGYRTTAIGTSVPVEIENWWLNKCKELLHTPYKDDEHGNRDYYVLRLSNEASYVWRNFSSKLEGMMRETSSTCLRTWLGKMASCAARIAAIYHLFERKNSNDMEISALYMQQACCLIESLIPSMQEVHNLFFPVDNTVAKAIDKIVNWLKLENNTIMEFKLRDMYRDLNLDSKVARYACTHLNRLGVLFYMEYAPEKRGRRATPVFGVNYQQLNAHYWKL